MICCACRCSVDRALPSLSTLRPRHKRLSQLMIYSTTACQSRCKHCNIWQKPVEHLSLEDTFNLTNIGVNFVIFSLNWTKRQRKLPHFVIFLFILARFTWKISIFAALKFRIMANKDLNRLKVVLVEQHKTAKWLAGQMEKAPATIGKWCTNKAQP